jgi:aminoglycoside phosphotransferase family enzyme
MTMIAPREPTLTEKLCFLSQPQAYPHAPVSVSMIETHMSYIFLAGARVYKLKKPVRYPFLDFSTLPAREYNCREEFRLNRRLAPDVYLGVAPLGFSPVSGFSLCAPLSGKAIVDWLVEMRRLPAVDMLDARIQQRRVTNAKIEELCVLLTDFYRRAAPAALSPQDYYARFIDEQAINRDILERPRFALDVDQTIAALDGVDALLHDYRDIFLARIEDGAVVDGHGDLRPEHICLTDPIVIFDCLEFNAALRQVDPYDELAYLGVECAALGAPEVGDRIMTAFAMRARNPPPPGLIAGYAAWRAVLRARLSVAHLLEPTPRQPAKWAPQARHYLAIATHYLNDRK